MLALVRGWVGLIGCRFVLLRHLRFRHLAEFFFQMGVWLQSFLGLPSCPAGVGLCDGWCI